MYATIHNLDTNKKATTGDYKTLTALAQNAILLYWSNNGRPNLRIEYFSSFESTDPFKVEYYDDAGKKT